MRNIYWVLLSVFTLMTTATHAGDFDEGLAALVEENYSVALAEFGELAEQGDARAQYYLGTMYQNGEGVLTDYTEALKWYKLAAEQDDASGQFAIGQLYYDGIGVLQDHAVAATWYIRAAENGETLGYVGLSGVYYNDKKGVDRDKIVAHMWANIAAANGSGDGAELRETIAEELTQADIATAQVLARECMASNYENCGY